MENVTYCSEADRKITYGLKGQRVLKSMDYDNDGVVWKILMTRVGNEDKFFVRVIVDECEVYVWDVWNYVDAESEFEFRSCQVIKGDFELI